MKKHNFSAGPAILPREVIEEAAAGALNIQNSGLSILEISHRGSIFTEIMEEARQRVKQLLGVGDEYQVLFLQGGASLQFSMLPYNLLPQNGKAAYINTGTWASKAIKEAKAFGNVDEIASSKDKNFSYIPKNYSVPQDAAYFHITTNNTIFGTQYQHIPKVPVKMVADMSSDIFSKPVNGSDFALIYAGAQKNLGPAGTTLVIIREDILGKAARHIPSMLDYKVHINSDSMFNTPSVFAVYVCLLTLRWIEKTGGLAKIEEMNKKKATLLYNEIDRNPLFKGAAATEDRSLMNITFTTLNADLEKAFLDLANANGVIGLKGHRSVGGFRASTYNALPIESVQFLVDMMKEFSVRNV